MVAHGGAKSARQIDVLGPIRNFILEESGGVPIPESLFAEPVTGGEPVTGTEPIAGTEPASGGKPCHALPSASSPKTGGRYVYDARTGNYRDLTNGRFVAARNLPWPSNAGFASSKIETVPAGTVLDRFGSPSGRFLSHPGATISQRGMAPGSDALPYTQYRVLKPFDAQIGPAAEVSAFNAVGGATQCLPGKSVQWLVDNNFLEVIK